MIQMHLFYMIVSVWKINSYHVFLAVLIRIYFSFSYLKPDKDKKSKHKTRVIKKSLNPEFNEVRFSSGGLFGFYFAISFVALCRKMSI
jgi:hypothetical protein